MTRYVEFPLEDGGTILIETPDEPEKAGAGFGRSTDAGHEKLEAAKQSLDAALENVRKSADLLVRKMHGLGNPPDEMEIGFYLRASSDLGNLAVAKNSSEANFSVTLRWRKDSEHAAEPGKKKPANRKSNRTSAISKNPEAGQPAPADEPDADDDEGDDH